MTQLTSGQIAGQDRLKEIALHYAAQHGLRPDTVEWIGHFDGWWLTVTTAEHSVKIPFSLDEIEDFTADGTWAKESKLKIRNAFASLSM